ncbi:coiled-coil domain-containing protein 102B [Paroedura picta]|uniref:coiled-coil domain-containing protein 102B n=1 Tax=Paroedura picta TaxID=143630 RepID=UPI004055BFAF
MYFDSVCNLMEDKQLLKNQQKEGAEENYARTHRTCKSNIMTQRVFPSSSYHHCMYIYNSSDWEICEELRIRELEDAKARTAQMEKTMRWWSDCTANWREKWSKVRAERNKAREEGRQLKLRLESTLKELSVLKKIKQHVRRKNQEVETDNIWEKNFNSCDLYWMKEDNTNLLGKELLKYVQDNEICDGNCVHEDICTVENSLEYHNQGINLELLNFGSKCTTAVSLENPTPNKNHLIHSQDDDIIHISMLRLHEMQKILQREQKVRSSLEKEVEKLKSEKSLWKWKYNELKISEEGNLKQFGRRQNEVEKTLDDLEEETGARGQKDSKMQDLQAEILRLHSENESACGRRKMLETENQNLDRENQTLKTHVKHLQDLLERKLSAINLSGDLQEPQTEILGTNKVCMDLQPKDSEVNKHEQDILTELMYTRKRVEQHKAKAKELSIRAEDLRKKINQEEDKV